jgi:hypothetical protein
MKSNSAASIGSVSASAGVTPPQSARASNAAAQDELKKRLGGGEWTVRKRDTLWGIAANRYGNGARWEDIRNANPGVVSHDSDVVAVGAVLDIPVLDVPDGARGGDHAAGGAAPAVEGEYRSTDFGDFEIYPDDFVGPLPAFHDAIQVVRRSQFSAISADAETQSIDPDVGALEGGTSFSEVVVVTIAGEKVRVSSKAEATHTARMFREIKEVYGIRVDASAGVEAVKARYTKVPAAELDKLRTREWEYKEVVAFQAALSHFAPILGSVRGRSARAGVDQEVETMSKVDEGISGNSSSGTLDTQILGEYLKESKNVTFYGAGTDSTADFPSSQQQLEGTAVHELAHALMREELARYAVATGYWKDRNTKTGAAGAEEPVTSYGSKNAAEDLSEAVMYYFIERATLKKQCPVRYAFIDTVVTGWAETS